MLLLVFCLLHPVNAAAYTVEKHDEEVTGDLFITSTKSEFDMDPGDTTRTEIKVTNRTGEATTLKFSKEDFEGSSDPSQVMAFLGEEESPQGARAWLNPEIDSIVLEQGETVTFYVDIDVPVNASSGGHYAALFASPTLDRYQEEAGASLTGQVYTPYLITISGEIIESGSLDAPEIQKLSQYGPIDIGLVFNNEGNVHLKPSGKVIIRDFFKRVVGEVDVDEWVVLPESSRRTLVQWDGHALLGRYTATAELNFGSDKITVFAESSFWVIPWILVLAVVGVLAAVIVFIYVWRRRSAQDRLQKKEREKKPDLTADSLAEFPPAAIETAPPEKETPVRGKRVPLSQLFPSMQDDRVVDIEDPETLSLIHDLIEEELDLARSYIGKGERTAARQELMEARAAAWKIGLLSEVGIIDDLLQWL